MAVRLDAVVHQGAAVRWAGLVPLLQPSHVDRMVAAHLDQGAAGPPGIAARPSAVPQASEYPLRSKEQRPLAVALSVRPVVVVLGRRSHARLRAALRVLQVSRLLVPPQDARLERALPKPLYQKLEPPPGERRQARRVVPLMQVQPRVAQWALPQPAQQLPGAGREQRAHRER